jgi:hypothetical protein
MGTHRVKLDAETEKSLARLRKATGLSVSEVLTLGIEACAKQLRKAVRHKLQG